MIRVLNFVYSHAVASQLTASSAVTAQTQPGYVERYELNIWPDGTVSQHVLRVSSPYSGGYTPTPWAQQVTPSVSFHEQYAPQVHNLHLGVPAVPPSVGDGRSTSPGTIRGPLPPAPNSLSQLRWAGSEQQILKDVNGGHG